MKITDPDIIKEGEKDLINAVKQDLDLDAVKQILKKRIAAAALASTGGEIVVHRNEIAFRLDFDLHLNGSLMFDRQGNYIPGSDEQADTETPEGLDSQELDLDDISIDEVLEEAGPQSPPGDDSHEIENQDPADDGSGPNEAQTIDEHLNLNEEFTIDLPDYDLDDDLDENLDNQADDEPNGDDPVFEELEGTEPGPVLDPEPGSDSMIPNDLIDEDLVGNDSDDDINDILKESRDFWEENK
jgi:hypothetical protein